MPTTTVKSIGTATRDYSTMQAWEDACPVNLVTNDEIWKGECYNDTEFSGTLDADGVTSDSTRYPWLTTASGESSYDDDTNALVYNQSNGVAVHRSWTGDSSNQFNFSIKFMIVEKIQWKITNTSGGYYPTHAFNCGLDIFFKDGIIEADIRSESGSGQAVKVNGYYGDNDPTLSNILVVLTADTASDNACNGFVTLSGLLYNCGVVIPTGLTNPGTGVHFSSQNYQSSTRVKSCYSFNGGGLAFSAGTWQTGSNYNGTDNAAAPGAQSLTSLTYADQFVSTTNTNWKLKSGSDLETAGNTDANNPNDIFGTVRASGANSDIGPHEFVAAGGSDLSITVTLGDTSAALSLELDTSVDFVVQLGDTIAALLLDSSGSSVSIISQMEDTVAAILLESESSVNINIQLDDVLALITLDDNIVGESGLHIMDSIEDVTGGPDINDGLLSFYQAGGATSSDVTMAEYEYLIARGVSSAHLSDMWVSFFEGVTTVSLTGSISDMKRDWFIAGAPIV